MIDEFGGAMVALRVDRQGAERSWCQGSPGRVGDYRSVAAHGAQRDHRRGLSPGLSKRVREVEESLHLGSAERVDRLIRVTDSHHRASRPGDATQELDLKRVGVLELVDVDRGDALV